MMNSIFILLLVLAQVESNSNDSLIGRRGEIGRYQIRKGCLEDANRTQNWNYTLEDMRDEAKARKVVIAYLAYYGERYRRKHRQEPSIEVLARIYNGGPNGYLKTSTECYWEKVKSALKE